MRNFIETLKANKQLTIAIVSSFVLIGVIIFILSVMDISPNSSQKDTLTSSDDIMNSESKQTNNNFETKYSDPSTDDEPMTDESGNIISDINFTLPYEEPKESETTLPANDYPYLVKVNRLLNCVTVYTKDSNDEFVVPYKSMTCSTGKFINNTPLGTFRTSSKYFWRLMVDGTHSQYASRVYGGILFHSVPCYKPSKDQLEVAEFNKLGSPASLGCIRLTVADAKWLHDNCPSGTTVVIYDDASSPGPLGKPEIIKIPEDSPNAGWDPTDPDKNNPWNNCAPAILASDVTIKSGSNYNIMNNVTATDTCGNDITSTITVSDTFDLNVAGHYNVTFSVTDLLGKTASTTINLFVTQSQTIPIETTTKKPEIVTPKPTTTNKETTTKDDSTTSSNTTTSSKETTTKEATTPKETTTKDDSTTSPPSESETKPQSKNK